MGARQRVDLDAHVAHATQRDGMTAHGRERGGVGHQECEAGQGPRAATRIEGLGLVGTVGHPVSPPKAQRHPGSRGAGSTGDPQHPPARGRGPDGALDLTQKAAGCGHGSPEGVAGWRQDRMTAHSAIMGRTVTSGSCPSGMPWRRVYPCPSSRPRGVRSGVVAGSDIPARHHDLRQCRPAVQGDASSEVGHRDRMGALIGHGQGQAEGRPRSSGWEARGTAEGPPQGAVGPRDGARARAHQA